LPDILNVDREGGPPSPDDHNEENTPWSQHGFPDYNPSLLLKTKRSIQPENPPDLATIQASNTGTQSNCTLHIFIIANGTNGELRTNFTTIAMHSFVFLLQLLGQKNLASESKLSSIILIASKTLLLTSSF
jgi:hypothetical protein